MKKTIKKNVINASLKLMGRVYTAKGKTIEEAITNLKPLHTFSVGYLLNENKESVLLGFMLFGEDMVKHNQLIPKGMIKKITKLKNG